MTLRAKTLAAFLIGAAAAGGVSAQLPPKPAAPAAKAGPPAIAIPGVSAAGNAMLTKLARTDDPVQKDAGQKLQAIAPQIAAVVNAQPFDVEKFAALMRQVDHLQATIKSRATERLISGVKALPAADRVPFLKAVSTPRAAAPAGR